VNKSELKQLKTELSKLSGVDMFNPKFRDIFKKYLDEGATDTTEMESAKVVDVAEPSPMEEDLDDDGDKNPIVEKTIDKDSDGVGDEVVEKEVEQTETVETEPDTAQAELPTQGEFEATQSAVDLQNELLLTKLELELVRAGVREDRLDTAKRLFMPEFKESGGDVEQIRQLIAQYPEWIGQKGAKQGFGMPIGQKTDELDNEEKEMLKRGINPRD